MNIVHYLLVLVMVIGIVNIIMSRVYRDEEKTDKGFELMNHKLTYRRRMLRGLLSIPFVFPVYFAFIGIRGDITSNEKIAIGVFIVLILMLEISYNYVKWRKVERNI
ncbi:hypothetical protein [Ornithinibacillus californiensis]|uniref:hypothetical protein n=1 Tax=Ornithinibacillus californiensis TaxID=161536 RepID=UPI00064DA35F|nr:hypothetical protein [Ornithinibacillus californiensis]